MIIARFMEVSLGYARIEVNTVRRRKDDKGLGPDLWMALSFWPYWPDWGDAPSLRTFGRSAAT